MIRVLPSHIANLIAAGEVVQRPSSVVKELMENAVDASATSIQVIIRDSGRTLIQVIDNGSGMLKEDAQNAFLRHATSKISSKEDLDAILTLGFRGEALASIAAVSEVTLRTKTENSSVGYEVRYAESNFVAESEIATPVGSNFMVRNLFYNVPARRKFLKSDATEFRQISREFIRVAITNPSVAFRLIHNDNIIFHLDPAPLKKRIQESAGKELGRELVELFVETPLVKISGYIGKPEDARKRAGNQYLFINNRYFYSSYFQKAVLNGYQGLIADDTIPSYFIFLEADPSKIDVNIHPSKTEIKFEDDYAIFDFLTSAVKESLGKNSFMPSIEFDMEGAPDIPKIKTSGYTPPPKINYDPLFNPFKEEGSVIDSLYHSFSQKSYVSSEESGVLFTDPTITQKPILQVASKYLITTTKSGMILVDIGRARERILFEKYFNTLSAGQIASQQNLFPQEITLSAENLPILEENLSTIKMMGFDLSIVEGVVVVNGLPHGFDELSDELGEVIDGLIFDLLQGGVDFSKRNREELASQLARSGSRGKYERMTNVEAQILIDSLFACKEPNYTSYGKKCFTIIDASEIDKLFFNQL